MTQKNCCAIHALVRFNEMGITALHPSYGDGNCGDRNYDDRNYDDRDCGDGGEGGRA
jgi:hypothetical protein